MSFGSDGAGGPPKAPAMWTPQGTSGPGWAPAPNPRQPAIPPTQAQPAFPPTQAQPAFAPPGFTAIPPVGFPGAAPAPPTGFAAAQPMYGVAPTGTGLPPTGPESVFEVDVPLGFQTPARCACCLAASQTSVKSTGQARSGRTTETRSINVPYCARCADHVKAGRRRGIAIGLLGMAAGSVAPLGAMFAWEFMPWWVFVPLAGIVALGALAALDRIWKAAPIRHDLGCSAGARPAGWIGGFAFHAPSTRVRFTNGSFAHETAQLHRVQPRSLGTRTVVSARWIAAPVVALGAAIPAFFFGHGQVFFDNPSNVPVTFVLNDGAASLEVPANAHDSLYVPAGEVHVAVQSNGATLEQFDGDLDHFGKAAVTPFGTACYAQIRHAYGSATGAGSMHIAPGTRWVDLGDAQDVFEASPHSVSVESGQTGATRVQFVRIDCQSGAPVY